MQYFKEKITQAFPFLLLILEVIEYIIYTQNTPFTFSLSVCIPLFQSTQNNINLRQPLFK
ncbi:MAG TPA: hypothetical protein DCF91_02970 [Porphyromonadaceae bacterium]|nr:hypothetical protein [Porphyromonadaceae bacterium]